MVNIVGTSKGSHFLQPHVIAPLEMREGGKPGKFSIADSRFSIAEGMVRPHGVSFIYNGQTAEEWNLPGWDECSIENRKSAIENRQVW